MKFDWIKLKFSENMKVKIGYELNWTEFNQLEEYYIPIFMLRQPSM